MPTEEDRLDEEEEGSFPEVPDLIKRSLRRYVNDRRSVGGFLTAVLENNLMAAIANADPGNRLALYDICQYVWNVLPGPCWGSPERVKDWTTDPRPA